MRAGSLAIALPGAQWSPAVGLGDGARGLQSAHA